MRCCWNMEYSCWTFCRGMAATVEPVVVCNVYKSVFVGCCAITVLPWGGMSKSGRMGRSWKLLSRGLQPAGSAGACLGVACGCGRVLECLYASISRAPESEVTMAVASCQLGFHCTSESRWCEGILCFEHHAHCQSGVGEQPMCVAE